MDAYITGVMRPISSTIAIMLDMCHDMIHLISCNESIMRWFQTFSFKYGLCIVHSYRKFIQITARLFHQIFVIISVQNISWFWPWKPNLSDKLGNGLDWETGSTKILVKCRTRDEFEMECSETNSQATYKVLKVKNTPTKKVAIILQKYKKNGNLYCNIIAQDFQCQAKQNLPSLYSWDERWFDPFGSFLFHCHCPSSLEGIYWCSSPGWKESDPPGKWLIPELCCRLCTDMYCICAAIKGLMPKSAYCPCRPIFSFHWKRAPIYLPTCLTVKNKTKQELPCSSNIFSTMTKKKSLMNTKKH